MPLEISHNSVSSRTATGEHLYAIGTICVELDLNDSIWYADCYVARNFKFAFLLGTDFLTRTSANLDLGNQQLKIGQQVIPVSVVKRPSQHRVCVIESLEIPARSEALLSGQVHGLCCTILVEPQYEIARDTSLLYPARSVSKVKDGIIPVNVANPYLFPVKIFSGTCIGMAETPDLGTIK